MMSALTRVVALAALTCAPLGARGVQRFGAGQGSRIGTQRFGVISREHLGRDLAEGEVPECLFCKYCVMEAKWHNCTTLLMQFTRQAAEEEGLRWENISNFGRSGIVKYPRSWVEKILAMNHTKVHTYNFQGRANQLFSEGNVVRYDKVREWSLDFAKKRFGPQDFLYVSDAPADWTPLGEFDKSTQVKAEREKLTYVPGLWPYHEVMAASNFTLCPRGDGSWSKRAYEAASTRSIPVINDMKMEWDSQGALEGPAQQMVLNRYHKLDVDDVSKIGYREDWADENFRTFIKYQTFMEGDNVPPEAIDCACPQFNDAVNLDGFHTHFYEDWAKYKAESENKIG